MRMEKKEDDGVDGLRQRKNTIKRLLQYVTDHEQQDSYNYIIFSL